jgi:ketosteroid isomerase-like protein
VIFGNFSIDEQMDTQNSRWIWVTGLLLSVCILGKCRSGHDVSGVMKGMRKYDQALERMDADAIAMLYAPDGQLGDVARGRDSIRNFLKGFSSFKVLSNESVTDSARIDGDMAFSKGIYTQVTILPSKDTVHLKGAFSVQWTWSGKEGWKIRRMDTHPMK